MTPSDRADSGWISVKERLPEIGEPVLVHAEGEPITKACVLRRGRNWNGSEGWIHHNGGWVPRESVTHYLPIWPLPNPPEEIS